LWAVVNKMTNFRVPQNGGNCLSSWETIRLLRRVVFHAFSRFLIFHRFTPISCSAVADAVAIFSRGDKKLRFRNRTHFVTASRALSDSPELWWIH
jgi:hypothetical protein